MTRRGFLGHSVAGGAALLTVGFDQPGHAAQPAGAAFRTGNACVQPFNALSLTITKIGATAPLPATTPNMPLQIYLHGSTSEAAPEGIYGDLYQGTDGDSLLGIMPLTWRVRGEGTNPNRYTQLRPRDKVLRPSDGRAVETHWCGYIESPNGRVIPYTERRLDVMIDDTIARYGCDASSVLLRGNSMGAWGCGTYGLRRGSRFAAIICAQPRWRTPYPVSLSVGYEDKAHANALFDDGTPAGIPFQARQDMIAYAANAANPAPFLAWSIGTQDAYGVWPQQVEMVDTLIASGRPFAVAWFNLPHSTTVQDKGDIALKSYLPPAQTLFRIGRGCPVLRNSSLDTPIARPPVVNPTLAQQPEGGINLGYSWTIVTETPDVFELDLTNGNGDFAVDVSPWSSIYAGDRTPQRISGAKNSPVRVRFAAPAPPPPPPPPKYSERVETVADDARNGTLTLSEIADQLDAIAADLVEDGL
jgi:hypothetical protein